MDKTHSLSDRCRAIEMLLLDVDGVLTDGKIIYTETGDEIKAFHVRDGSALKLWQAQGKKTGIITGRRSKIVQRRADELGIDIVIQGSADKGQAFHDVLSQTKLSPEQFCFMGDDLPDLPVLLQVGLAVTVADACAEVIAAAHFVTQAPGGGGAVRETVELLLRQQGVWQGVMDTYHPGQSGKEAKPQAAAACGLASSRDT